MKCGPACCVLILLALAFACDGAESDYRKSPAYSLYAQANALFTAQKFQESLNLVEQALLLDPKLLPALTLKAKLAMAARNPVIARDALLQAVRVAPESWYAHFLLGFHYYMQSDMRPALASLEEARRLNPKESQPYLYLGLTHESLGNIEQAVVCYSQAIKLEESARALQSETLLTLARLLLLTGSLEECSKLLDRAIKIEPESRDAYYELARLLMKQGNAAKAAQAGEKALSLPPAAISDRQIRYVLVRAHGLAGNEERAREHAAALRDQDVADPPRP